MRKIDLHPDASEDIEEAYSWYRKEASAGLAEALLNELDKALEKVAETPDRWPTYIHDTRRFVLKRFPYTVVYRYDDEVVRIVAVPHQRQRPGHWRFRRW